MKSKSKSKSDSSNSSPLKMNSLSSEMKEKRLLIDRILDKLNENKLYTVAVAIFLELKANNYEAASTKIINQKILSDFKTNKRQYLKNERESEYYDSEVTVQRAIVASLTVTNVLRRIKKGNQTFVKFNFAEAEEYLKKIKNRQINSIIREEVDKFYNSNSSNKNLNKEKENSVKDNKENKDNLSSMDMNDENFQDDISISLDSNFIGDNIKTEDDKNKDKMDTSFDDLDKNLNNNLDNSLGGLNNNNNLNNSLNNNSGINLNGGIKKRTYIKRKKGLIDNSNNNIKKLKLNRNNDSESDSEEIKMLENYDMIHDTNRGIPGAAKKFIKHRRRRRRSNKMMKNNLEIDIKKFRGRPKKKVFGSFPFSLTERLDGTKKNYPFISINNAEGQNYKNNMNDNANRNSDKVIEIVEESSEEIKSRQINNYLEHLYSFNKLENSNKNNKSNTGKENNNNSEDKSQTNSTTDDSMKNITDKSLNIISKIKVLYEQMDKMEDSLESLNNLFGTTSPLNSTYQESESSTNKKDNSSLDNTNTNSESNKNNKNNINIFTQNKSPPNETKAAKIYKNMKKNEDLLDMCYNNMKLSLQTLDNIYKFKNMNKNNDLIELNKNMLKEYEKTYMQTLENFSKNLNDINELAFNHNALKIYENIKDIKKKLMKEKISIGPLDDFLKKLENNLENESNKYFNIDNIKQIYIDKKKKLMDSFTNK